MPNAADILIDTLIEWEVKVIFGLPGDGINGGHGGVAQAPGPHPLHSGPA